MLIRAPRHAKWSGRQADARKPHCLLQPWLLRCRQTLLFSATMPRKVERLAGDALTSPVRITVGEVGGANEDIKQVRTGRVSDVVARPCERPAFVRDQRPERDFAALSFSPPLQVVEVLHAVSMAVTFHSPHGMVRSLPTAPFSCRW